MDEKKFCFIMCANKERYERTCLRFIDALEIPAGYKVETRVVHGALSMTQGYNQAMEESDAKYKIYLHQDSFVTERTFLTRLLDIFSDETIGMIGLVGSPIMPEDAVMWHNERVGANYECNILFTNKCFYQTAEKPYTPVQAIDGFLMATQTDISWREDIFTGWDFYDVSQSYEFRRAGYQVVVPYMERPWCMHDCGVINLENYYSWRDVFVQEYMGDLTGSQMEEKGDDIG